jgi:hypothetical protein
MILRTTAHHLAKLIGVPNMTKFLNRVIDAIPTPTPEQGDRAVNLTLVFVAGFIFAMLVFGY